MRPLLKFYLFSDGTRKQGESQEMISILIMLIKKSDHPAFDG